MEKLGTAEIHHEADIWRRGILFGCLLKPDLPTHFGVGNSFRTLSRPPFGLGDPSEIADGAATMKPHTLRSTRDDAESEALRTFVFSPPASLAFAPGQYVEIEIPGGPVLPMAIANGIDDEVLELSIRRTPGTDALFDLRPGDEVLVSAPQGTGFPLERLTDARRIVLVAGGTGITPVRSLLRSLPPAIVPAVIIGARTPEELLYLGEFDGHPCHPTFTVDTPNEGWNRGVGRVTDHLRGLDPDALAFTCGPEPMMAATVEALVEAGFAHDNIYVSVHRYDEAGKVQGPVLASSDPLVAFGA